MVEERTPLPLFDGGIRACRIIGPSRPGNIDISATAIVNFAKREEVRMYIEKYIKKVFKVSFFNANNVSVERCFVRNEFGRN